jgi:hypothetical protein
MNHFTADSMIAAILAAAPMDTPNAPDYGLSASLDRYPDRELGIGYGRSSGYASKSRRTYADHAAPALMRVG